MIREYLEGRIPRWVVENPLASGRSTVSEHMCDDLIQEYGHMQSSLAKSEHISLRDLSLLVHNCQRRQAFLQAHGFSKTSRVPPPGVPNGVTRDDSDRKWAESLVSDKETEGSKDKEQASE